MRNLIKRFEFSRNHNAIDLGIFITWNPISNWEWTGVTIGLVFWRLEIEV